MISEDITVDHTVAEIDEQIELLEIMADRNAILAELLRVTREAKSLIQAQNLQIQRLEELIDFDAIPELTTVEQPTGTGSDQ